MDLQNVNLGELVGGYSEILPIDDLWSMVMNDEGYDRHLPVNEAASQIAGVMVVGDVVVCLTSQIA
jgi:hypothetical protein